MVKGSDPGLPQELACDPGTLGAQPEGYRDLGLHDVEAFVIGDRTVDNLTYGQSSLRGRLDDNLDFPRWKVLPEIGQAS